MNTEQLRQLASECEDARIGAATARARRTEADWAAWLEKMADALIACADEHQVLRKIAEAPDGLSAEWYQSVARNAIAKAETTGR